MYAVKNDVSGKRVVLDDMILTKDMPTTAGSKMLEGYMSPFDAEVVTRLKNAGYGISGKAKVGEFAIDLLANAPKLVKTEDIEGAVCLNVNGSVLRGAAQNGVSAIKPTYGTVSRYGTIPVACSGEAVTVVAKTADAALELLKVVSGHDDKDGTSLSDEKCKAALTPDEMKKKAILFTDMYDAADAEVQAKLEKAVNALAANGVEVVKADSGVIKKARIAWNILMSAELCNNVSRYDGVKYGYRSKNYTNIDELYTNSRTEAFGDFLKKVILFGSETLSTDNYMKVYDKAMRVRRVISEEFAKIFREYDVVILPTASAMEYKEVSKDASFEENLYTAPASITGLPAVVSGGVQFMGKAFSEGLLIEYAKMAERSE